MTARKNKNDKPRTRLTQQDVIAIVTMRKSGSSIQDICSKYYIKRRQVGRILNGTSNSQWTKGLLEEIPKQHAHSITNKQLTNIIEMRKNGKTLKCIADKYDLDRNFVSKILGRKIYQPRGKLSKQDISNIVEMRNSGNTLKQIGNKYSLTEQYVGHIFKGKKLVKWTEGLLSDVKDNRFKLSDKDVLNIIKMLKNHVSQEKIAMQYDISQSIVSKIYKGEARKNINEKHVFTYECKHCGELFKRTYNVQEFCSPHCRLWYNIDKKPFRLFKSPCYPWKLDKDKDKYGKISWKNDDGKITNFRVIRLVLEEKLGRKMLPGMIACHTCDNPVCCNPKHLYEGTHKTNKADCVRRDRNGNSKLTTKTVTQILKKLEAKVSINELAKKFNVSRVTIYTLRSGKSWKHIPRES